MVSFGAVIMLIGFLVLVHSTIQVTKYREVLKVEQLDFVALPATVVLEVLSGLALALAGAYVVAGPLKTIRLPPKGRSMNIGGLRTDFLAFNHRAKAMPLDLKALQY